MAEATGFFKCMLHARQPDMVFDKVSASSIKKMVLGNGNYQKEEAIKFFQETYPFSLFDLCKIMGAEKWMDNPVQDIVDACLAEIYSNAF
jgi:hypothetical protein